MVHHSIILNIEGPSWRLHQSQQLNSTESWTNHPDNHPDHSRMGWIPVGLRPPSIPPILESLQRTANHYALSPTSQQLQGPQTGVILTLISRNDNFRVGPSRFAKGVHFISVVARKRRTEGIEYSIRCANGAMVQQGCLSNNPASLWEASVKAVMSSSW